MRVLFLGDIVGEPGRKLLRRHLANVRAAYGVDFVVANAENVAGGSGLTAKACRQLRECGVDAFTMGDHVYRNREIRQIFAAGEPVCRPANYPPDAPGPCHVLAQTPFGPVAVFCLQGRVFLKPADCPFRAADRVLETLAGAAKVIVVDMHAEATSEKQLMYRYLAGRVSAVFGTHTHVPTADATVHPAGTAYLTDVGMTGPYDSIIGREVQPVLQATLTFDPAFFVVAQKDPRLSGALLDVDAATGRAERVELLHLDEARLAALAPLAELGPGGPAA